MPTKKIFEHSIEYFDEYGRHHREDGPAIECKECKLWYLNGKLHRVDGPAIEYANGDKSWYLNGRRHREAGPAIEWQDGYHIYYWDGIKKEYNDLTPNFSWHLNGLSYTRIEDFQARLIKIKEENSLAKETASPLI